MVVCLNPSTVYLMDIFSHIPICWKNCNDKDENEQKEAGESPFKKYFSSTSVGSLYKDILSIYKCEPESVESVRRWMHPKMRWCTHTCARAILNLLCAFDCAHAHAAAAIVSWHNPTSSARLPHVCSRQRWHAHFFTRAYINDVETL